MRTDRAGGSTPERVVHTLEPVFDRASRVLILGTMPSPRSREAGFYYSHPQNRFWRVLSALLGEPLPETNLQKRELCLRHGIALWDVLAECSIQGADDGSIRDPVPNDLGRVLSAATVRRIYTTGSRAAALYRRYCLPVTGIEAVALPSTSPANCRYHTLQTLIEAYRVILPELLPGQDEQTP